MYIFLVAYMLSEYTNYFIQKIFSQLNVYFEYVLNNGNPVILVNETTKSQILYVPLAKKYEKYQIKTKDKFMLSYELPSQIDYNSNIEDIFYDPEKHHYAVLYENNEHEKRWRTRVLIESIPNGSVIMYYDPYKRGFVYFSMQSIPYHVLNAVAMKYVLTFRCRYFFMDESEIPENCPSKLVNLEKWDLKENSISNSDGIKFVTSSNKDVWTQSTQKGPFAKFKKYNTPANKAVEQRKGRQNTIKNRFIYLGNPRYYSILQKIPFPVQAKKKMSYKDFKALKPKIEPNTTQIIPNQDNELDTMCMKLKPNA